MAAKGEDTGDGNGGRVTTREFYEFQKDMRDEMRAGFDGLGKQYSDLDKQVAVAAEQRKIFVETCQTNREDITSIKRQSNRLDAIVLFASTAITAVVAAVARK